MEKISFKVLTVASFFLLCFGWAGSLVYAQNQSESPVHEMPEANRCSVVMMHIRELAFSLKQVTKEISLLEQTADSASESSRQDEQQMNQYDQKLTALKEKKSYLRKQMSMQEQQLENCMQQDSPPKK